MYERYTLYLFLIKRNYLIRENFQLSHFIEFTSLGCTQHNLIKFGKRPCMSSFLYDINFMPIYFKVYLYKNYNFNYI